MSRPLTPKEQRAEDRRRVKAWKPATDTLTFGHYKSIQTYADLPYLEDRHQICEPFETENPEATS